MSNSQLPYCKAKHACVLRHRPAPRTLMDPYPPKPLMRLTLAASRSVVRAPVASGVVGKASPPSVEA
jgi:hypothetical protein